MIHPQREINFLKQFSCDRTVPYADLQLWGRFVVAEK